MAISILFDTPTPRGRLLLLGGPETGFLHFSGPPRCSNACDAPKPGGPLTTRQPAEYKWMSGYPTPL